MNALRKITTREEFPLIKIPESFGQKFEVIILPVDKKNDYQGSESEIIMKVQEESGFLKELYNDPNEDIWNNV